MKKFVFIMCFALLGCSSNKFLYKNKDGINIYQASCDTLGYCYEKANFQCKSGFDIIDKVVNANSDFFSIQIIYKCR